jgi:hypothetical protein
MNGGKMKIELTQKDLELLLLLVNEAVSRKQNNLEAAFFSLEERMLIEKLESALNRFDFFEKGFLDNNQNDLRH